EVPTQVASRGVKCLDTVIASAYHAHAGADRWRYVDGATRLNAPFFLALVVQCNDRSVGCRDGRDPPVGSNAGGEARIDVRLPLHGAGREIEFADPAIGRGGVNGFAHYSRNETVSTVTSYRDGPLDTR